MIIEKIDSFLMSKRKRSPVPSNRASELGHPCTRYLVYRRTVWQEQELPDLNLTRLFYEGIEQEQLIKKLLRDAGIKIVREQEPFEWKEFNITGHIDGMVEIDGQEIPVEIKGLSPYVFPLVNTEADLYSAKQYWLRNYLAQMTLYLLLTEKEKGFFIFKNKTSGEIKEMECELNYEFGEQLLKKAKFIEDFVARKKLPDRIDRHNVCRDCGFRHICLPIHSKPINEKGEMLVLEDTGLEEMLERRILLLENRKELDEIQEYIAEIVKQPTKVGKWTITPSQRTRKEYTVSAGTYYVFLIKKEEKTGEA